MKLSAPIHILKQRAKDIKRAQSVPLSAALNDIAKAEGFASWSLLQAKAKAYVPGNPQEFLGHVNPGDLVLIGARPGLGKTQLALQLLLRARQQGRPCFFFSLEYARAEIEQKLAALDDSYMSGDPNLSVDVSDQISASYIIAETTARIQPGSLIAIDYLQLLDQQRQKPPLQAQVAALKAYVQDSKSIVIIISQIDRTFDAEADQPPGIEDIRLPNPLDLALFNKKIFVHGDRIIL